jgi:hypothetical protein
MDNVQNCDSYINIPSSQTYSSDKYIRILSVKFLNILISCLRNSETQHL